MKQATIVVAMFAFVCSSQRNCWNILYRRATDYVRKDNLISSLLSTIIRIKTYRTVILRVFLHGCETWSLTLREGRRLRLLRGIFGPKRDEVTGDWRKLHNEELNDLYSSPSIIRVIKSRRMR